MKAHITVIVYLCVTLLSLEIISALKCYKCKAGMDDKCLDPIEKGKEASQLDEQNCDIAAVGAGAGGNHTAGGSTAAAGAAATTAAAPAKLIERDEFASAAPAAPAAPAGPPAPTDSAIGCIKLVGTKDGNPTVVRGCGADGCTVTKTVMGVANDTCHFCSTDLCNSSVRIYPLGWISFLMMVTICFGLEYY